MFENLEISQKLYSLKLSINDVDDLLLIDKMIDKYKTEINVDFEYTKRELKASKYVFYNIQKHFYKIPKHWDMPDEKDTSTWVCNEDIFDKNQLYEIESEKLVEKFSLLRLKNNKTKNELTRQNSVLIQNIFLEELEELIIKIYKS